MVEWHRLDPDRRRSKILEPGSKNFVLQATSRRGEIPWRPERAQIHQEAEECAAEESAAETSLHQVSPQLPPAQAGQSRRPLVFGLGVLKDLISI